MAHHQHHGAEHDAQTSRSLQTRPVSAHATSMPSITEDEQIADVDEPPDPQATPTFTKHVLPPNIRRQSLLTRALHTDSESHDEEHYPADYFSKQPSVSSTASSRSVRSAGDFTSDDGHHSPSTRASTPASPRSVMSIPRIQLPRRDTSNLSSTDSHHESDQPQSDEATIEAKLGRKRCIMFSGCKTNNTEAGKKEALPQVEKKEAAPAKRPCTIKFACPFKASKSENKPSQPERTVSRHLSPAPLTKGGSIGGVFGRRHRGSDTTIRNESPTTPRAESKVPSPARPHMRRLSSSNDLTRSDAGRFHEFASEEEEHEDWTQESTCHRSRLTVSDTLKKENDIRKLAEEADEENALEDELDDELDDDSDDDDAFSDDSIDSGHQTDDEDGFAESSDDEDEDGDYEWWAPRKSAAASPYIGHDVFRPVAGRTYSDSSLESSDGEMSPKSRHKQQVKRSRPFPIRTRTPELPDSTDFVCGTLDEDRPQEQAYIQAVQERKASKKKACPQDIDPSFPTSDPEMASDEEDEAEDLKPSAVADESDVFLHGHPNAFDDELEPRGRRLNDLPARRSPKESPKRLRSPPPPKKSCAGHRSPAPQAMFGAHKSPPMPKKSCAGHRSPAPHMLFSANRSERRMRSPPPSGHLTSPPPSRRGSTTSSPHPIAVPFLGSHNARLTHTASLPRSPHPFFRKPSKQSVVEQQSRDDEDEEDEGSATDRPDGKPYTRGAIDIAHGLEKKRLKRREKFYRQYCRKEEKKERRGKKPVPGQGAERMRQIGTDFVVYRGPRMLSI